MNRNFYLSGVTEYPAGIVFLSKISDIQFLVRYCSRSLLKADDIKRRFKHD